MRHGTGRLDIKLKGPYGGMAVVLAAYLVLATAFNARVPVFEAPDEHTHFFFAQHLAFGGALPVQPPDPDDRGPWEQEGSQPPLYYALVAPVVRLVNAPLDAESLWYNHQNTMGQPALVGSENRFIHPPAVEGFPWHGYALAVHLVRLVSTLLGLVTVASVATVARYAFPGRPWLWVAVAAVAGLNPQFLFVSAAVSNDALVTALASLSLALILRLAHGHVDAATVWALALAAGLAPLAKLSGLAVAAFALASVAALAVARRDGRLLVRVAVPLLAIMAVADGWWYARNLRLYGEATGISRMLPEGTRRDFEAWPWMAGLPAELRGLWLSTWGLFGWFTVLLPAPAYWIIDIAAGAAAVGLGLVLTRRPPWLRGRVAAWLAAWGALVLLSLLRWMTLAKGAQGRLLFGAIAALATLLVAGWRGLLPRRVPDPALAVAATVAMAGLALVSLEVVAAAYAQPPTVAPSAIPASATAADVVFQPGLRLLAVDAPPRVTAGGALDVTMYWRADTHLAADAFVALRVDQLAPTGAGGAISSSATSLRYPGDGNLPPRLMEPGRIYVDRRRLTAPRIVRGDASGPALPVAARLAIHLFDADDGRRWPSPPLAGQEWSTRVVLDPVAGPTPSALGPLVARFDPGIDLHLDSPGADVGGDRVAVTWVATAPVTADLSVFVHAVDPRGATVATADGPPASHGYYPTSAWQAGDVLPAEVAVARPPSAGGFRFSIGLYDPATGRRLAAFAPGGRRYPRDEVPFMSAIP